MNLHELIDRAEVWRASTAPSEVPVGLPTGFAALNAVLPGGGWPRAALTEILIPQAGVGELRLLLPMLAALSRGKRWLAFVAPPYIPYAPAWQAAGVDISRVLMIHPRADADGLWALEQTLRAGTCEVVLAWPARIDSGVLRRLQRAAQVGGCLGIIFRPERIQVPASPAALRLRLEPRQEALAVHVLKRRGAWPTGPVMVSC